MSREHDRYKRFTRVLLWLGVALLGLDGGVRYLLLRTAEGTDLSRIVRRQQQTGATYLSLLNDNEFEYKVELVEQRRPVVIALGSSSVLQFREEFFDASFVNAGRAVTRMDEAPDFLHALEPDRLPEVMLLGIDFWEFHSSKVPSAAYDPTREGEAIVSLDKIRLLYSHWTQDRVPVRDMLGKVVFGEEPPRNRPFAFRSMGLSALAGFHGFRPDGSFFYGDLVVGRQRRFDDREFRETLNGIDRGDDRWQHGDAISETAWTMLTEVVETAEAQGVHVIVFMPPVAPSVIEKLQEEGERYRYLDILRRRLASRDRSHDYLDPRVVNATDCEFIDGFHGGDVVFQRILLDLAKQDEVLRPFVDVTELRRSIHMNRGRTLTPFTRVETSPGFEETDFLGIGCDKRPAGHEVPR